MKLNKDTCYKIIKANDARFDGVFFLGVETTGIYCRPTCKVPAPKKENCTYYQSAAKAESQGFRPCLRCRPEMAPDYSEFSQKDQLISSIIDYFKVKDYRAGVVGEASEYFGVSSRHINRIFHEVLGVAPKDYVMTKRLLRAKALLTDTNLSMTKVSELSGFGSPSRFSEALKKHYRLTPSAIRKEKKSINDYIVMNLYYRPPYNWDLILNFLRVRAIPHVEMLTDNGIYRRSLQVKENNTLYSGWLEVKANPEKNKVLIKISNSLEDVIITVIQKVRKAFDLDLDPSQFPDIIDPGVRLPGCFDSFEVSCRAIIGQQVTVKAATTLSGRVAEVLGKKAETPWKEVDRYFPRAEIFVDREDIIDVLGSHGIISARSSTMMSLGQKVIKGEVSFTGNQAVDKLKSNLLSIKGIGPWSAEYISMRGISWPDAFPVSDLVIKNKLLEQLCDEDGVKLSDLSEKYSKYIINKKYEKSANKWIEDYRPWRSYMSIAIWNDLINWKD